MRRPSAGILHLLFIVSFSLPLHGGELPSSSDMRAIESFRAIQFVPGDSLPEDRILYGDSRGYIHILKRQPKGFSEEWRSGHLGAGIMGVFAQDIDGDERRELVTYTSGGRIFIFALKTHSLVWQSNENEFADITCMTVANADDDPQEELVFCADSHLFIYDGKSLFQEWKSQAEFRAQQILVGDVDGDGQKELILNTGLVLDARFHDVEWQSPDPFGDRIALLDVDSDGIPEVIGEFGGHFLKTFDIDLKSEKW